LQCSGRWRPRAGPWLSRQLRQLQPEEPLRSYSRQSRQVPSHPGDIGQQDQVGGRDFRRPRAAAPCRSANVPIELWDSGLAISTQAGDTLHRIATTYHVPLWTLTQLNKVSETAALTEGQRIVIPHSVGQKLPAPNPVSSEAAGEKLPSGSVPNP